jgi:hypothetical protein
VSPVATGPWLRLEHQRYQDNAFCQNNEPSEQREKIGRQYAHEIFAAYWVWIARPFAIGLFVRRLADNCINKAPQKFG